jgi:hypothetical protein
MTDDLTVTEDLVSSASTKPSVINGVPRREANRLGFCSPTGESSDIFDDFRFGKHRVQHLKFL